MVNGVIDEDVLERARSGLVGFVWSGPNSGRYILLHLSDALGSRWSIEFSYVDANSWDLFVDDTSHLAWGDLAEELSQWSIEWSPPEVNDRVMFRAFSFSDDDLPPEWRARRDMALEDPRGLEPVVPGGTLVRPGLSAAYLQRIITTTIERHQLIPPQEGLGRLRRSERRALASGSLELLRDLSNALWDSGYALAVVPLNASARIGSITDPWEIFRDPESGTSSAPRGGL